MSNTTNTNLTTVIVCPVGKKAYVANIDTSLESLQSMVQGLIEFYYLDDEHFLVCNEEGKLIGLPLNRCIIDDTTMDTVEVIAGNFIIAKCSDDGDGFEDLTEEEIDYYMERFLYPEDIFRVGRDIVGIPYNPDETYYQEVI